MIDLCYCITNNLGLVGNKPQEGGGVGALEGEEEEEEGEEEEEESMTGDWSFVSSPLSHIYVEVGHDLFHNVPNM